MESRFELRKVGNELAPLAILALTSMLLVGGMGFAVQKTETAASITRSAQVILGALTFGLLALAALVLSRGKPREVIASASPAAIVIGGSRRIDRSSIRHAYVIRDGERWSVELERLFDVVRLLTPDRAAAERLVGELRGTERAPAAVHRLKKKAHYLLFSSTCVAWTCVFASVVAFAFVPVAGALLMLATLPVAVWVTLKAVPAVVVVEPAGLTLLHPLAVRSIQNERIVGSAVIDDDAVRIDLVDERSMVLDELANHPRDREAHTSAPPAERFAASLSSLRMLAA
jgi:hypothetical protein